MDESRALRDTLERTQVELRQSKDALAKLRVHYAREREVLVRQLEEAQREVAELRARLDRSPEPRAPEPPPEPLSPPPSPAPKESFTLSTGLVALMQVPSLEDEETLGRLGRLLRLGVMDLRLRLGSPPPIVLARLPTQEARMIRDSLRVEGFAAVSCEMPSRTANPLPVRRFTLGPSGLRLEGERGERRDVLWKEPRLLVLGKRTVRTVKLEQEMYNSQHSRRPRMREVEVKGSDTSHFLWMYGEGLWVSFSRETEFQGLEERREPSYFASLQTLAQAVREQAPQVVLDDRLLNIARLSVPLMDPERGHETIGELLWQAVLDRMM